MKYSTKTIGIGGVRKTMVSETGKGESEKTEIAESIFLRPKTQKIRCMFKFSLDIQRLVWYYKLLLYCCETAGDIPPT